MKIPKNYTDNLLDTILIGSISFEAVQAGVQYKKSVEPRLKCMANLMQVLDGGFTLYTYEPSKYNFYTKIKADYLIASEGLPINLVFMIQSGERDDNFACCSAFELDPQRDYRNAQKQCAILKKERVNISNGSSRVLYERPGFQA